MTNIDNFFKEHQDQITISDSNKEIHWQQMQQLILKNKTYTYLKYGGIAAGFVAIIVSIIFFNVAPFKKIQSKKNTPLQNNTSNVDEKVNNIATTVNATSNTTTTNIIPKNPVPLNKQQPSIGATLIAPQLQPNFYIDLSKAPETFTIDPTKENTITCKQGTTITIPPNTVIDNNNTTITVAIQEYYDYQNKAAKAGMLKYSFYNNENELQIINENSIVVNMKTDVANNKNVKLLLSSDIMPDATFKKMQWVTNEKFITNYAKKTDVKVQLPSAYNAKTFMSQLAFINHNAIIAGDIINNSIVFRKVPIGETVYFMSLGKIKDKYFSCNKKLNTSFNNTTELDFIEISELLYKKQLEELGKLGQ